MKRVLLLDNYDSFTYNLVHLVEQFENIEITVERNNSIDINSVALFDAIILSPGPGLPQDAGIMPELIKTYYTNKPIFGVCLGMQALGMFFGAELVNMPIVQHGVRTEIQINSNSRLFKGMPNRVSVGRYHSWAFAKASLPDVLFEIADDGSYAMAFEHTVFSIAGVQFQIGRAHV